MDIYLINKWKNPKKRTKKTSNKIEKQKVEDCCLLFVIVHQEEVSIKSKLIAFHLEAYNFPPDGGWGGRKVLVRSGVRSVEWRAGNYRYWLHSTTGLTSSLKELYMNDLWAIVYLILMLVRPGVRLLRDVQPDRGRCRHSQDRQSSHLCFI